MEPTFYLAPGRDRPTLSSVECRSFSFSQGGGGSREMGPRAPTHREKFGISSTDKTPLSERLVLIDSDFGRAYLTEGWARRFLCKYTILFIEYGHNDIVIEYLARGLPPQADHPGRFALKIAGNADDA